MAEKEVRGKILWTYVSTKTLSRVCEMSRNKASKIRNGKATMNLEDFLNLSVYLDEMNKMGKFPKFNMNRLFRTERARRVRKIAHEDAGR